MPEMRNFTVTQTREVKVVANSVTDAIRIAEAAFHNGQNSDKGVLDGPDVWGNTESFVREIDLRCTERPIGRG